MPCQICWSIMVEDSISWVLRILANRYIKCKSKNEEFLTTNFLTKEVS